MPVDEKCRIVMVGRGGDRHDAPGNQQAADRHHQNWRRKAESMAPRRWNRRGRYRHSKESWYGPKSKPEHENDRPEDGAERQRCREGGVEQSTGKQSIGKAEDRVAADGPAASQRERGSTGADS